MQSAMKTFKLSVRHYLEKRIGKGEHPVYISLCYKRKVTQIKSVIAKRFVNEKLMLKACKEAIAQETAQIESLVREGERSNPSYSIYDFTKRLKANPANRLEGLVREINPSTLPNLLAHNKEVIQVLNYQRNAINRQIRLLKAKSKNDERKNNKTSIKVKNAEQLSLFI